MNPSLFIRGRATTNFVPINTRLARKTSSSPGSFLLPTLTTTDLSTNPDSTAKANGYEVQVKILNSFDFLNC